MDESLEKTHRAADQSMVFLNRVTRPDRDRRAGTPEYTVAAVPVARTSE
jgi:hypothetical protein